MLERAKKDKLYGSLLLCWVLTVLSSFVGNGLLLIPVATIGSIFPFRILLPITAVLYQVWSIRNKEPLMKGVSIIEKWCYLFVAILIFYGVASLFRAIDLAWTFRRLVNLCFDLCFFFLMLRLCKDKDIRQTTFLVCFAMLLILCILGIYEVFCGGLVSPHYDNFKRFTLLNSTYQSPAVFSSNTNDYATSLIFIFAVMLLFLNSREKNNSSAVGFATVLLGAVVYFLVLAASARLNKMSFLILLAGTFFFYLFKKPWKPSVPILLLLCMLSIQFVNQYRYIIPPIQQYLIQLQDYAQNQTLNEREKPNLVIGNSKQLSLAEQFFEEDETTGAIVLSAESSAGVRTRLLIHSAACFQESYGLGVGLGNTEMLARDREVIDEEMWSIHCFVARLLADYGLFALIPLVAIVLLLIRQLALALLLAIRCKNRNGIAYVLLFFCVLITYPFASTASSDAQDIISMWIYLASMVIFSNQIQKDYQIGDMYDI